MALLYIDGFDAGDMGGKGWTFGGSTSSGTAPATRFGTGRWGSVTNALCTRPITASSQLFIGLAMAVTYFDGTLRTYISFHGDSGATQHLTMGLGSTGFFVYRGGPGATLLAFYPFSVVSGRFYYFEVSATINATTGNVTVKLDGTTIINFTGNTKNGGTNTTIDTFGLGANGGVTSYFDDLYICNSTGSAPQNTFLGDIRIHTLTPDGAGSVTQMTPSAGANYTTVDEVPYSATDYVRGSAGQTDLYTTSDLPAGVGTIFGVQANAVVKKTDAGTLTGRTVMKNGTTTTNGTAVGLGAADATVSDLRQLNPDTSTAWTTGDVNSIEVGVGAV